MLAKAEVGHFDETGVDVNGKTIWVHNSSTSSLTYQTLDAKREDNGVLPGFKGIAAHDCWTIYWKYRDVRHAICCAHLLRELNWVEEFGEGQEWATRFKRLLLEMKKAKERTMDRGQGEISQYYSRKYDAEYDEIITEAEKVST